MSAVVRPDERLKSWSFSAIKLRQKCPFAAYLRYIEHAPRPVRDKSDAAERGLRIHKEAEEYVDGTLNEYPKSLENPHYADRFKRLRERFTDGAVATEDTWYFGPDWAPATKNDRIGIVIIDSLEWVADDEVHEVDYKSGKKFGNEVSHMQQLQLYAVSTMMRHPEVNRVKSGLWYLDQKSHGPTERVFTRQQLPVLSAFWNSEIKRHLECAAFPPKANRSNCKYCDYGTVKGTGRCPYAVSE